MDLLNCWDLHLLTTVPLRDPTPTPPPSIPKLAPKRGVRRVLQTFMDQYFKPSAPPKDDSDNDAIVVLTRSPKPKPQRPLSPSAACKAILVEETKRPVKHRPKNLRLT